MTINSEKNSKRKILRISFPMLFFLLILTSSLKANNEIEKHLREWREKISLASQYLKEAEKILKDGNPKEACIIQKKASSHAIDAIESLKIAFIKGEEKINEEDLLLTLSRWKSIGEKCNYY